MPKYKLTADNAYDTLARLLRARALQEQAIKEAMDLLWAMEGDKWDEAYTAAEYAFEDVVIQEQIQCVIDAIEELTEVLSDD
jgi:hypothetical protein